MTPAKKGGERRASRPADVVFVGKMGAAYQTALNLIGKAKSLSAHRALRGSDGTKLAAMYNRFIERVAEELSGLQVQPGKQAVIEEAPSLSEFLSG